MNVHGYRIALRQLRLDVLLRRGAWSMVMSWEGSWRVRVFLWNGIRKVLFFLNFFLKTTTYPNVADDSIMAACWTSPFELCNACIALSSGNPMPVNKSRPGGRCLEGDDLLFGTRTWNVLPGYDPCGILTSNGIPATWIRTVCPGHMPRPTATSMSSVSCSWERWCWRGTCIRSVS